MGHFRHALPSQSLGTDKNKPNVSKVTSKLKDTITQQLLLLFFQVNPGQQVLPRALTTTTSV